nr:SE-cephalotoxin-like [Cherax quadricarinatus]
MQEKSCDVFELSQLMFVIGDLMTSAAKQTMAYQFLKYQNINYVREKMIIFSDYLQDIRYQFDIHVWDCYSKFVVYAEQEVKKIVQENDIQSSEALRSSVQERLSDFMPWYEWRVAIYTEDVPKIIHTLCGDIPLNLFMLKQQFMIIENLGSNDTRKISVVWKDNKVRSPGCQIASGFNRTHDPCKFCNVCSNHGICHHIPYTNDHLCICDQYYEGDNCEIYNNPAIIHIITDIVADMRINFASITGVPTVVDVYAHIVEIKLLHELILNANVLTQALIQYEEVFREAEYITYEYNKLKTFTLSKEMFLKKIMNIDFHRILSGLERAILGKGIFISHDILSVFKKKIISELNPRFACTQNYSVAVLTMVNNLLIIDEVVTETSILVMNWQVQHLGAPEDVLDVIHKTQKLAEHRREKYFAHWEATSCTELTDDDLQEKYCGNIHSYSGLQVFLNCENNKQPSTSSVTCTRVGNTLQWTETPNCQYVWSSWSSWGSCTVIKALDPELAVISLEILILR